MATITERFVLLFRAALNCPRCRRAHMLCADHSAERDYILLNWSEVR